MAGDKSLLPGPWAGLKVLSKRQALGVGRARKTQRVPVLGIKEPRVPPRLQEVDNNLDLEDTELPAASRQDGLQELQKAAEIGAERGAEAGLGTENESQDRG